MRAYFTVFFIFQKSSILDTHALASRHRRHRTRTCAAEVKIHLSLSWN